MTAKDLYSQAMGQDEVMGKRDLCSHVVTSAIGSEDSAGHLAPFVSAAPTSMDNLLAEIPGSKAAWLYLTAEMMFARGRTPQWAKGSPA